MTAPDLTRTCQNESEVFTSAALVAALEDAWSAIRTQHPEVPAAVLVVASGSPAKASGSMKWGHFADGRWQHGDNTLPEVLVSGEGLNRPADKVFTTLLHEATHGLAAVRGIKDTSRQGRWHNKSFAKLAAELGMTTTKDDKLGFSPCELTEITAVRYRASITTLAHALRAWRHPEVFEDKQRTNNNNGVTAECECPRKLRISLTVFEAGPIRCDLCGEAFLPEDIDRDEYNAANPQPTITGPSGMDGPAGPDEPDDEGDDPMVFYDPTGARYGLPTYPYHMAPEGLATTRQLRAKGLRPGRQPVAAQILWRRGQRKAYLYRLDAAQPKRPATPAQLAALAKAMLTRRTCPTCEQVKDYYIPTRYGECLDCTPGGAR
jgi:hypothetical protein